MATKAKSLKKTRPDQQAFEFSFRQRGDRPSTILYVVIPKEIQGGILTLYCVVERYPRGPSKTHPPTHDLGGMIDNLTVNPINPAKPFTVRRIESGACLIQQDFPRPNATTVDMFCKEMWRVFRIKEVRRKVLPQAKVDQLIESVLNGARPEIDAAEAKQRN